MNDQISNILTQVRLLKRKYDELAAVTGEQFNVFSILGVEADEVRTHSALLADLLDPQGSHRQGDAFLKLFLGLDAIKSSEFDEYKNPETFRVSKEVSTDQGRIDILLENKEACIVIENKIYAGDQGRQMERYYQYATSKGFSKEQEQIKLVYLTLDGSAPSKESLGSLSVGRVKCLSYSKDIIKWLEECMKLPEVQRVSPIREIVFQYRDLLKQLTGQSTNKRLSEEMKNILVENKNYELIPELEEMILTFKVDLQYRFWSEMRDEIDKILNDVNSSKKHGDQSQEALERDIRNFYTASKYRFWFGLTFKRDSFKLDSFSLEQTEIALSVECCRENRIGYGFQLYEDDKVVGTCDDEKFDALAEKLRDNGFKTTKWWIGYKESAKFFPLDCSGKNMKHLLDDSKRTELIQEFVTEEIVNAVNQLKDNLSQS